MMHSYKFALATIAAFAIAAPIAQAAETTDTVKITDATRSSTTPTCAAVQLKSIRTDFPQASQSRGESGDVILKVTIGQDGRAAKTQVAQSSGYRALDKAAADSVVQHWRFDVARCAASQLPTDSFVTVQFQRAPRYTVYGSLNTHRVPASNSAQTQAQTLAQGRCDTARNDAGDQIVACLSGASPATTSDRPSLASRSDSSSSN
jgi:TonB family protein